MSPETTHLTWNYTCPLIPHVPEPLCQHVSIRSLALIHSGRMLPLSLISIRFEIGYERIVIKIHSFSLKFSWTSWFPQQIRQECFVNVLLRPSVNLYSDKNYLLVASQEKQPRVFILISAQYFAKRVCQQNAERYHSTLCENRKLVRGGPSDLPPAPSSRHNSSTVSR